MAINYQPLNIKQAEFVSAKDVLSDSRKIREDKRKYAVEKAMREALSPTGDFDPDLARKSLANSGFGEEADAVVRDIANKRLTDVSNTADIGVKLKSLVDLGIISQDKASELFGKTTKAEQVPVEQVDNSWMNGVPSSAPVTTSEEMNVDGTVNITGSSMVPPPSNEYKITNKKGQAVTDVASDMFDFSKKSTDGSDGILTDYSTSLTKYNLPADENQSKFVESAFQNIGIAPPGKDAKNKSEYYQKELTGKAVMLAGPMPEFGEFIKGYTGNNLQEARAEFAKAKREWSKNVAENYDKIIGTIDAARGKLYGETLAGKADERSEKGDVRAEREQQIALSELDPKTNPVIWKPVKPENLSKIYDGLAGVRDMKDAKTKYEKDSSLGSLVEFAVAKLKANSQPVTMDAVETFVLQSGAIPSASELIFKKALRDLNVKDLATFQGLTYLDLGISPTKAPSETFSKYIKNAQEDIYSRGGVVEEFSPSAKDVLKSKQSPVSIYSETKMNNAGVKVGKNKKTGKWEVIK